MSALRHYSAGTMRGQAMVEFALTIGVFLTLLLGAVSASFYTMQRGGAVTAVAAAARAAASATPGDPDTPNLEGAGPAFDRVMGPVSFGTHLAVRPAGSPCPQLSEVPRSQVVMCATREGTMIKVRAVGWPANPVSGALGFDWPLDVFAEVHQVTFAA